MTSPADPSDKTDRKRLGVLKEHMPSVFLASGNQCAYHKCTSVILDATSGLVGEAAHIEGVQPGSARYRADMTTDELRHPNNLVLMCHQHHVEVDRTRVDEWPVERMRQMKADHEDRFTGAIDQLAQQILDVADGTGYIAATNLGRITEHDPNDSDFAELVAGDVESAASLVQRLADVPLKVRSFMALVIRRGELTSSNPDWIAVRAHVDVVEQHSGMTSAQVQSMGKVLEAKELGAIVDDFDDQWFVAIGDKRRQVEWLLTDIKRLVGIDADLIERVFVDLDFTTLDT